MTYLSQLLAGEDDRNLPLSARTDGYQNALVVKSGAGLLLGFSVYNSLGASQWIQVFDVRTLTEAPDGARPEEIFVVATVANLNVAYAPFGCAFNAGCVIVNSTTGPTKTIGAANCYIRALYV